MGPLLIGVAMAVLGATLTVQAGGSWLMAALAYSLCGAIGLVAAAVIRAYPPRLPWARRRAPTGRPASAFR